MRRSILSLTASRSCAGVMGVDRSETAGSPLTCTAGRVGGAIVRSCSARISVPVTLSISAVRVGRPVAPEPSEQDPSAMFGFGELKYGRDRSEMAEK